MSQKTREIPRPLACVSVDLDSLACYRDIHGLPPAPKTDQPWGADRAYSVGVKRLVEFFNELSLPSTLFVVGSDTAHPEHREILSNAHQTGHELANHSFSHFYDLPKRPTSVQADEIARAEEAIAQICGARPLGFRAPGYNISAEILEILAARDYLYDSSIFPCPPYYLAKGAIMGWQRLSGRPSRSSMVHPWTLAAPITPYRPAKDKIWRPDPRSNLPLEIPMCLLPGLRFPVIGTTLPLLGKIGFDAIFPLLRRAHTQVFQLEFHAVDFMDAADLRGLSDQELLLAHQPDLRVPWPHKRAIYRHVFSRLNAHYDFSTIAAFAKTFDE